MDREKANASVVAMWNGIGWLLIKRSKDLRSYPNKWAFPGGRIEKDEEPILAACREVWEEVGVILNPLDLTQIGYQSDGSKKIFFWICSVGNSEIKINNESQDWGWFNVDDIIKMDTIPIPDQIIDYMKKIKLENKTNSNKANNYQVFGEDWMD